MIRLVAFFLLMISASLYGTSTKSLLVGDVSPEKPQSDASMDDSSDDEDTDETGETDEDIIITEDENTNDDEGVNN